MMNEKNTLTIDIKLDNPCYKCNGDCDACPHYIDPVDYSEIEAEAESFRLSVRLDLRKHNELTISL